MNILVTGSAGFIGSALSKYLFDRTGVKYSKENILITPGSKEAMLLMHITFNGEILTPAPSWVSYEPQAEIGSNKVHWIETKRENNWFQTGKELEKKIKAVGKNKNLILILNSQFSKQSIRSSLQKFRRVS